MSRSRLSVGVVVVRVDVVCAMGDEVAKPARGKAISETYDRIAAQLIGRDLQDKFGFLVGDGRGIHTTQHHHRDAKRYDRWRVARFSAKNHFVAPSADCIATSDMD